VNAPNPRIFCFSFACVFSRFDLIPTVVPVAHACSRKKPEKPISIGEENGCVALIRKLLAHGEMDVAVTTPTQQGAFRK